MEEIMTRKQVADYLKVSLSHFAKDIQPRIKQIKLGKNVRFRKSDVDEFINNKLTSEQCNDKE